MNRKLCVFVLLLALCRCAANSWIEPPLRTARGYPVPQPDTAMVLPAAHGAHPEYAIEWWYWVGHLQAVAGDETFGFQATVFRLAGAPAPAPRPEQGAAALGEQQLFMSHAALSELSAQRYQQVERVNREGWQARAARGQLDLWASPIRAQAQAEGLAFELEYQLPNDTQVQLTLTPRKPMVSFGERGLSRKGADPAAVSLYWSYTRLQVAGRIIHKGVATEVEGVAWQDHEIASSQLGAELAGWDSLPSSNAFNARGVSDGCPR